MIIGTFLSTIQDWASGLGGIGLFLIALLDSSFLSFPQVNDLLIIYLSTKYPERMPFYAGMTTAGSLFGCFLLYAVARKGGEVFLLGRSAERPKINYPRRVTPEAFQPGRFFACASTNCNGGRLCASFMPLVPCLPLLLGRSLDDACGLEADWGRSRLQRPRSHRQCRCGRAERPLRL